MYKINGGLYTIIMHIIYISSKHSVKDEILIELCSYLKTE